MFQPKMLLRVLALGLVIVGMAGCHSKSDANGNHAVDAEKHGEAQRTEAMEVKMVDLKNVVDIDLYTDFSCPWCYIGAERVVSMLESYSFSKPVRFHHRVYLLSPDMPEEGVNIPEDLRRRYGREPADMFARVEAAAHAAGLPLDLSKVTQGYPTLRAHALLLHAEAKGTQDLLKRDIFRANFVDAKNINDVDVLIELGVKHGFTEDEVRSIVTSPAELDAVRRQAMRATTVARGVPFFVFNEDRAISGAQPENVILAEIVRAGTTGEAEGE